MELEWDEGKRLANCAKHGLDFAGVISFPKANAREQKRYGKKS